MEVTFPNMGQLCITVQHFSTPPPVPAEMGQLLPASLSSHRLVIGMCLPLHCELLGFFKYQLY